MTWYVLFHSWFADLGNAGPDEPILAGVIVFGGVGMVMSYLSFVHEQMEAGPVLKVMSIGLLLLAVVSYFWPMVSLG